MPNFYEKTGLPVHATQEEVTLAKSSFESIFSAMLGSYLSRQSQAGKRNGDGQFNTILQAITLFSNDTAEIVREYFDEFAMIQDERQEKTRGYQHLLQVFNVLADPKSRYQYDKFVLGLEHSMGEKIPSRYFETGVISHDFSDRWNSWIPCGTPLYDRRIFIQIGRASVIALPLDASSSCSPYESILFKKLTQHPNYPLSKADLFPLHETVLRKELQQNTQPAFVILDPSAMLSFIQQCKQACGGASSWQRRIQGLLSLEAKLFEQGHTGNTPRPFEFLQEETCRRSGAAVVTCIEAQREAMLKKFSQTWFFRSSTKQQAQNYLNMLQNVREHMNQLLTHSLNEEKLSAALEHIRTSLEKFPESKELVAEVLRTSSPEQREALQKNIGLLTEGNALSNILLDILQIPGIVDIVKGYLEEEEEPSIHPLFQP